MRGIKMSGWLFAAFVLASMPAGAMTVDEVVARHIEARGGLERWEKIESMQLTGTFTAFSQAHPFTLHRTSNDKYHLDHVLDDKRVVIGYDGDLAWWENDWMMPGSQKITGIDLGVAMREFDFPTPFFDYKGKGYRLKLVGESELEGQPGIAVELIRPDDTSETWYFDPETYLEIGRISPGSDFGSPMEQRTFYDDFREVKGVMIPHLREAQWYTRDRVMLVENVRLNLDIDDALFRMPPPPGMGVLLPLAGTWHVALEKTPRPEADWTSSERRSTIASLMNGGLLREEFTTEDGTAAIRSITFDRYNDKYRVTQIDDHATQLDVQEGVMEDGRLVVSNAETGTNQSAFGGSMILHGQIAIFDIGADGFKIEEAVSTDGGENWFVNKKATYTRTSD